MRITTNSNKELVNQIREKLKDNDGYCPCRVQKNEDTKCMCKEFKEQMERGELGECHCGLYVIVEA
ncbi:MAG: ferredoxin thioredoxin reductase catalytic beta chain [Ruminococcus sp.]|nr:ferredoxin thioredoxin reductase catalytic beta chain [Ruminococcus sp.]